jgi:transcriptional antiterminator RfaH
MPWYVLYTKPRNEKKTARLLEGKNIEVYCPLKENIRQWSDRKKKVQEPVFPSYIFVHLDNYRQECNDVLITPGAVRFLWWLGKPGVVRDSEVLAIRDFLDAYKNVTLTYLPELGQRANIEEGPLKQKTGRIIQIRGKKAVLHLESIGMNLIAEIPVSALNIITKHAN